MATIKSYQEQVQDIVEKAIAAVEEQHKALASASFTYAEKYTSKVDTVKSKHDEVADLAYGKVREVNKLVNDYAGDLILKFEKPATAKKAPAKKATAKKATAKKAPAKKAPAKKEEATA